MTTDADRPVQTASELNRRLRAGHGDALLSDSEADSPSFAAEQLYSGRVRSHVERLERRWGLTEPPTVADVPILGRVLARIPLLGGALSFMREVYGWLWLMAHRRLPIGQQIQFNRAVTDAFAYLQDLSEIGMALDRELQICKKDVALTADDVAVLDGDLRVRMEALTTRLDRLESQIEALQRAVAEERPTNN